MKKRLTCIMLVCMLILGMIPGMAFAEGERADYELRTLTFEDEDYKGGTNFAGGTDWSSMVDSAQYGGPLLYGEDGNGVSSIDDAYKWEDTRNTGLSSVISEGYGSFAYFSGGHAVSNYVSNDLTTYGNFNYQLTVYKKDAENLAREGGGNGGSDNFAVHYGYADESGWGLTEESLPALSFPEGEEHIIDSMYVNNICYTLNAMVNGNDLTAAIGAEDYLKIVATGYDKDGQKNDKTAEFYLCNGPENIVKEWTKWDLSGLGEVGKVTFNVVGSNDNGYGTSMPAYFAYDDVAVRFAKTPADTKIAVSIKMNTTSPVAKLYATDEEGVAAGEDLLAEVTPESQQYEVDLEEGEYLLKTFAGDGETSCGTIKLTVSEENTSFTVVTVMISCSENSWVLGTDYTVENVGAKSGGDTATVTRQITTGYTADGAKVTVPVLDGDTVFASLIPSAAKKAENYVKNDASKTVNTGFDNFSIDVAFGTGMRVTYPYFDADEDGKNDYQLEVGKLTNYFIFSYNEPASETVPADGKVTATFTELATKGDYFYRVTNPINEDAVTYGNYKKLAAGNNDVEVTAADMYVGDAAFTSKTLFRDFSKSKNDVADLYLSFGDECEAYDGAAGQLSMTAGQDYTLYPFRNWLAIEGISNSEVVQPDFHVETITLNGSNPITVAENLANDGFKHSYNLHANSEGTALVLVTYDSMRHMLAMNKATDFSAIWPENTGVIIVNVGKDSSISTNMLINEELNKEEKNKMAIGRIDAELDVLYYTGDEGASYSFKPEDGVSVSMSVGKIVDGKLTFGEFSAKGIRVAKDGTLTLTGLTEGKTIVKLTKGEKVTYQVIRAKQAEITVKDPEGNVLTEGTKVWPGEKLTITYNHVFHPANKLSGIYNMSALLYLTDSDGKSYKGKGDQYAFAQNEKTHTVTVTVPDGNLGEYTISGVINATGFGSYYGMHRILTYDKGKTPNFTALQQNGYMGRLPEIKFIKVADEEAAKTPDPVKPVPSGSDTISVSFRLIGATLSASGDYDLEYGVKDSEYINWVKTKKYTIEKESTVGDLFEEAMADAGLSYKGIEKNYISTIYAPSALGGYELSEFTNGARSGWMYTVNGKHPDVGLNDYTLKNGDKVVWHYINDYSYECSDWFEGPSYPNKGDKSTWDPWLKVSDKDPKASNAQGSVNGGAAGPATEPGADPAAVQAAPIVVIANPEIKVKSCEAFTDVKADSWFESSIDFVLNSGLMQGVGDGNFNPSGTLSGAQIGAVLGRMVGEDMAQSWSKATEKYSTSDINRENTAKMLYEFAKEHGLVSADFAANGQMSEELAAFTDASSIEQANIDAMNWAISTGLFKGVGNSYLDIKGSLTRAQFATLLERYVTMAAK